MTKTMKTKPPPAPNPGALLERDGYGGLLPNRAVVLAVSDGRGRSGPKPGIPWVALVKWWQHGNEAMADFGVITCNDLGPQQSLWLLWHLTTTSPLGDPAKRILGVSEPVALEAVLGILPTHGDIDEITTAFVNKGLDGFHCSGSAHQGVLKALGILVRAGRAFKGDPAHVARWGLTQAQADERARLADVEHRIVSRVIATVEHNTHHPCMAAHGSERVVEKLNDRLRRILGWGQCPLVFRPEHFRPPSVYTEPKFPESQVVLIWLGKVKITGRVITRVNRIVEHAQAQRPHAKLILLAAPTTDLSPLGWPIVDPPGVSLP